MLELHQKSVAGDSKKPETADVPKRSKFWLLLSLSIFLIFILLIVGTLLRFRFLYLPGLSNAFGGEVMPTYALSADLPEPAPLSWADWKWENNLISVTFTEERATGFLRKYLGEDWQIIFQEGSFELFGPVYSSVNNEDYWSEAKVIYTTEQLKINLNGLNVPERLNNYLLNYIISSDEQATEYFEKIELKDKKIKVIFSQEQQALLMKNFNPEEFFKNLIKYLIYEN